jgi:hypothetical protein
MTKRQYLMAFLKFNAKKGGGKTILSPLPQFLKVGRAIAPSSFAHEVVLVKFELQTHTKGIRIFGQGYALKP